MSQGHRVECYWPCNTSLLVYSILFIVFLVIYLFVCLLFDFYVLSGDELHRMACMQAKLRQCQQQGAFGSHGGRVVYHTGELGVAFWIVYFNNQLYNCKCGSGAMSVSLGHYQSSSTCSLMSFNSHAVIRQLVDPVAKRTVILAYILAILILSLTFWPQNYSAVYASAGPPGL